MPVETSAQLAPFGARLEAAAVARRSVLCVGLDPRPELLPEEVWRGVRAGPAGTARAVERFCEGILEATAEHAVAVKPQLAFFEALGHAGLATLERLCAQARELGLLVVLDGKRGDIGSTAEAYAAAYLRRPALGDALTVNPYLGGDAAEPFLRACREDGAGLFVLVRTSNPGAGDIQELALEGGGAVWERVAALVDSWGAQVDPGARVSAVGAVVGATAPQALERARALAPRAPFLLPGIGAQGGRVEDLAPAFAIGPAGGLVSASRSILYAAPDRWQQAAGAEAARLRQAAWSVTGA
jgi:orotidine-5'-phosphate decarboxylase